MLTELHPPTCTCDDCRQAREVEAALDYTIDEVLDAAWSLAASNEALWRARAWPLIARVEGAHQEGDVDGHAEDELRELVRPLLLTRVRSLPGGFRLP